MSITARTAMAIVAITRDEARVWNAGLEKGSSPERLHAPSDLGQHHHVRQAQHNRGHDTDHDNRRFYESIAQSIAGANEVLIVGHGKGKADHILRFTQFLERKHPATAAKVVGAMDSNLNAMTEAQILATAREWFDHFHTWGF
ncbi:MAG: hypothetical protein B7C54_12640 [Acidimicrobiales bacterium mtb01]|nr:MAG: hypothetical protein B7C54_12640 [Acidimicrobiales bacterium mtb01]